MANRTSWSKEVIIKRILDYQSKGIKLDSKSIIKSDRNLYNASRKYFGSWRNAIIESGIEYTGHIPNTIFIKDKVKYIKVTNREGEESIVTVDCDEHIPSSVSMIHGYPSVTVDGKNVSLHGFIYGKVKEGNYIDHIDRNPLNACKSNLREVTPTQNSYNSKSKGYYYDKKKGKYKSSIRINGKLKHIGSFNTPKEARISYLQAKLDHHGEEFSPLDTADELNKLLSEFKYEQAFSGVGRKLNEFKKGDIVMINSVNKVAIVISNNNDDTVRLHEINNYKGYTAKPHQLTPISFVERQVDLS